MGRRSRGARTSLAYESGCCISLAVSLCVCLGHLFFAYAQASGQNTDCTWTGPPNPTCDNGGQLSISGGGLFRGVVSAHVDFEAQRALGLAVSALEGAECKQLIDCPEGQHTAIRLPPRGTLIEDACTVLECGGATLEETEFHFSYWFSIYNMWNQDAAGTLPDGTPMNHTGYYPARPAAGALFGFSFVWPHLKLFLMHLFFYLPLPSNFRRNGNYWLAFWGKWSLADALVMCCVIGLFNLTLSMDFVEIWNYFHADIDRFCHSECGTLYNTSDDYGARCNTTCLAVEDAITKLALNYDSLPASDIAFNLRISGLMAMYSFCAAVIISLSTGVVIENLDEELRERQHAERELCASSTGGGTIGGRIADDLLMLTASTAASNARLATAALGGDASDRLGGRGGGAEDIGPSPHPLLADDGPPRPPPLNRRLSLRTRSAELRESFAAVSNTPLPKAGGVSAGAALRLHSLLVALQFLLAVCALFFPIFTRDVTGGLAYALKERKIDFDGAFSMAQLAWLAGQAGGPDYFMAGTCFVFLVVGPILRPLTQLWLMWVPMSLEAQKGLHRASRHISIFYAFEVMLLAVPLLNLAFGPMTNQFLSPGIFPPCEYLEIHYNTPANCLQIGVNPDVGYWFTMAAYALYLISGVDGSPTHKYLNRSLYPDDRTPPNCD